MGDLACVDPRLTCIVSIKQQPATVHADVYIYRPQVTRSMTSQSIIHPSIHAPSHRRGTPCLVDRGGPRALHARAPVLPAHHVAGAVLPLSEAGGCGCVYMCMVMVRCGWGWGDTSNPAHTPCLPPCLLPDNTTKCQRCAGTERLTLSGTTSLLSFFSHVSHTIACGAARPCPRCRPQTPACWSWWIDSGGLAVRGCSCRHQPNLASIDRLKPRACLSYHSPNKPAKAGALHPHAPFSSATSTARCASLCCGAPIPGLLCKAFCPCLLSRVSMIPIQCFACLSPFHSIDPTDRPKNPTTNVCATTAAAAAAAANPAPHSTQHFNSKIHPANQPPWCR